MKIIKVKAILFMALALGVASIANAQSYGTDINQNDGIALRANNDSSNHYEWFRFYTGKSSEVSGTNYLAELSHRELTLNGRTSSQGANVVNSVGTHFAIRSVRGLTFNSDYDDNNTSTETIKFKVGSTVISEIQNNGVRIKLIRGTDGSLPFEIGGNEVLHLYDDRISYRRKIILNDGTASNNRIGIGTTSPSEGIHLRDYNIRVDGGQYQSYGPIILRGDVDESGDDRIEFRNSLNEKMASIQDGNIDLVRVGNLGGEIRSNGALLLKPEGTNDKISFYNSDNQEKTRIQDGIIYTDEVRLNVSSFPDYVFAKDYQLMPLNELSDYIQENKHLPNMPSESEVVSKGMNVSQINTALVEKIEELTLYTIGQEEKLQSQDQKIALLLEKIEALEASIHK